MINRLRLVVGSVCLLGSVAAFGAGCAKKAPPPAAPAGASAAAVAPPADDPAATASAVAAAAPSATPAGPAAAQATQDKPYTKEAPGPWDAAVAAKHSPEITYVKAGKGLKVTVKVDSHPMDAAKPHYIMWIRLEDAQGTVLGKKDFVATDAAPVATFDLANVPPSLKALEQCNIHGIWANTVAVNAH